VVEDVARRESRLYNYGEFSFDDKMLPRYAMGHLEFWVGERPVRRTLEIYSGHNRSIRIQVLNLDEGQRLALARALADNALPENKHYLYDHFTDNCATRPRDMLDRAIGGQLRAQAKPGRMTLRDHTRRHTAVSPLMSVLIDFLLNDEVDRPITTWEEAFLPGELEAQVAAATLVDSDGVPSPLVRSSEEVFVASRPPTPATPPLVGPWLFGVGLGAGAALALSRRRHRARGALTALVGLLWGGPGAVLFLMATMTDHAGTRWNENLFLANPLTFALFPLGLVSLLRPSSPKVERLLRGCVLVLAPLGLAGLLGKLLPSFDQDNVRFLALGGPLLLGLAIAHLRRAR
jgi:hypothetical protein